MEKKNRFRGLVKGLGKIKRWVYGGIFYVGKRAFIVLDDVELNGLMMTEAFITDFVEVRPETVGQYIGSHAENDKDIYKGDIVQTQSEFYDKTKNKTRTFVIEWFNGQARFLALEVGENKAYEINEGYIEAILCKVIGNIHDDKEENA